jgi:hypothetical protein
VTDADRRCIYQEDAVFFLRHCGLQSDTRCSTVEANSFLMPYAPVPNHPRGLRNPVTLNTPGPVGGHKRINLLIAPQAVRHDTDQKTTNTPTNSITTPYDFFSSIPGPYFLFPKSRQSRKNR